MTEKDTQPRLKILLVNKKILHGTFVSHEGSVLDLSNAHFADDPSFIFNIKINESDIVTFVYEYENEEYNYEESLNRKRDAPFYETNEVIPFTHESYDQIKENEKRFGIKINFDENIYTNELDKESEFYKKNIDRARIIEKEILKDKRRIEYEGEEKYSCVKKLEEKKTWERKNENERYKKESRYKKIDNTGREIFYKKPNKEENKQKIVKSAEVSKERKVYKKPSKKIVWECDYTETKRKLGMLDEKTDKNIKEKTENEVKDAGNQGSNNFKENDINLNNIVKNEGRIVEDNTNKLSCSNNNFSKTCKQSTLNENKYDKKSNLEENIENENSNQLNKKEIKQDDNAVKVSDNTNKYEYSEHTRKAITENKLNVKSSVNENKINNKLENLEIKENKSIHKSKELKDGNFSKLKTSENPAIKEINPVQKSKEPKEENSTESKVSEKSSKRITFGKPTECKFESLSVYISNIKNNFTRSIEPKEGWGYFSNYKDYKEDTQQMYFKRR